MVAGGLRMVDAEETQIDLALWKSATEPALGIPHLMKTNKRTLIIGLINCIKKKAPVITFLLCFKCKN